MTFNQKQTWLTCINPECGHKTDLLSERRFRCPECDSLYDIEHNFDLLNKNFNYYKKIFDERASLTIGNIKDDPRYTSGVWRFHEWIMPFLPVEDIISLGEGICPIIKAGKNLKKWCGGDINLFIVMEGVTPTGSFKDYGGTVLMSIAKSAGIKSVACASTGDTSAMAAAYASAAGIKCAVILPKGHITNIQLAQPLVYGARIINLPGDFDDCMRVMEKLVKDYNVYPANSLNPARIEGHQSSVFQVAQAFGWKLPDWIALPVGNGSNCSSIGKGMRLLEKFGLKKISRILACQSSAANPLAESFNQVKSSYNKSKQSTFAKAMADKKDFIKHWEKLYRPLSVGTTTATAARIGDPVSRVKVMREIIHSNGIVQTSNEIDLNKAVAKVGLDGHFICPQTGIALAGVRNAVREGVIKKGETVVVISTATGLKFADSAARNLEKNIIDLNNCDAKSVANLLK